MGDLAFEWMVPTFPGKDVHRDTPLYEQLDWQRTKGAVELAEQLGYEGYWAPDHFTLGIDNAELEVWTVLSTIAGMTETGTIGPLVSAVLYRNPALLGKMTTTLDVTSNGRSVLGIGAGWHEKEHRTYGYEFPSVDERIERLDEAIRLIKTMWTDTLASFKGDYYQIDGVRNNPPPVQNPHPPVLIGGGGPKMLRLIARHADIWNVEITARTRGPPTEEKIEHLERYLEAEGRAPDDVEYSWLGHCLVADSEQRVEELLDRILPIPSASPDQEFELTTAEEARKHGEYFIGTPAEVAEQIEAVADMGFERFQLLFVDYPSLDGLTLFADEVMDKI